MPMELSFSSEWELAVEPDAAAWCDEPLATEHEELAEELEIPASASAQPLQTDAWNLGSESRSPMSRAVAMAAAFVPLMLSAQPVFGAPPVEVTVPAPTQENAAPTQASPMPVEGPAEVSAASIWNGLRDHHVLLTLSDGTTFRGTVLSATDDVLVCARASDGLMVLISIGLVSTVHVEGLPAAPKPKAAPNGQALIVFGSIATAIGGALTIAGAAVGASCATGYYEGYICPYYSLPLGLTGVVNLAVGIPLLVAGVRKRAASRAAEPAVSAFVLPGREGVMGGVGLRF
jgi:hypothetical protein